MSRTARSPRPRFTTEAASDARRRASSAAAPSIIQGTQTDGGSSSSRPQPAFESRKMRTKTAACPGSSVQTTRTEKETKNSK
eukprot:4394602-Prymnesium_polylepis.1